MFPSTTLKSYLIVNRDLLTTVSLIASADKSNSKVIFDRLQTVQMTSLNSFFYQKDF